MGAVVTTRAVARAFSNGMEYFNTFGGNPVGRSVQQAYMLSFFETRVTSLII